MKIHEVLDFRRFEDEKRRYLREQVRVLYGTLSMRGSNSSNYTTPSLSFGCIRFMEEPNLTAGYKIKTGSSNVNHVDLSIVEYKMDYKGLYSGCKFKVYVNANGAYTLDVYYQLQGKCHLIYEKGTF